MHANTTIRIHEIPQDNLHQEPLISPTLLRMKINLDSPALSQSKH